LDPHAFAAISGDGSVLVEVAVDPSTIAISRVDSSGIRPLSELATGLEELDDVAIDTRGSRALLVGTDTTRIRAAYVFDLATRREIGRRVPIPLQCQSPDFAPDVHASLSANAERAVMACSDANTFSRTHVVTWRVDQTGTRRTTVEGLDGAHTTISDRGVAALWGSQKLVTLSPSGHPMVRRQTRSSFEAVAFSSGGDSAAMEIGSKVSLVHTDTWRVVGTSSGAVFGSPMLRFAPNGKQLLVSSEQGCAGGTLTHSEVLAVPSLKPEGLYCGSGTSTAVTTDGSELRVIVLENGALSAYSWRVGRLAEEASACTVANRRLSRAEWRRYVGPDIPYKPMC
jgi:hypothetical protein